MSTSDKPATRGFGPIALIVTGVVCFAAGYMVSDATKALTVPEAPPQGAVPAGTQTPPSGATPTMDDRSAAPEQTPAGGAGSVPGGAGPGSEPKPAEPKHDEPKPGAGVPEGTGSAPGASVPPVPAPR